MKARSLEALKNLVKSAMQKYGGRGTFELPDDHRAGLIVPKGGSCCANCRFVSADGKSCGNKYWQKWSGGSRLPAPADQYCCDWWTRKDTKD